jgi:hypothetical protein
MMLIAAFRLTRRCSRIIRRVAKPLITLGERRRRSASARSRAARSGGCTRAPGKAATDLPADLAHTHLTSNWLASRAMEMYEKGERREQASSTDQRKSDGHREGGLVAVGYRLQLGVWPGHECPAATAPGVEVGPRAGSALSAW